MMVKWSISIRTLDEELIHKNIIEAADLANAKQQCLNICKDQIKDKDKLYLESRGKGCYVIVSDLDDVGQVRIERMN
ncbi:MAG TPA: hypothetical protein ENN97_07305 [Phycisphaerales bacterium]|nr:hypothetical protein [Phycisphaerales bacterium]